MSSSSRIEDVAKVKGQSRKERAARNRTAMLDAAWGCFTDAGYSGSTMADIAERAGVAVQTLYFTFHTKGALLAEVFERAVLGPDELPPPLQPFFKEAEETEDLDDSLRIWCDGVAGIVARVAPLRPVFDGVAGDDEVTQMWQRGEDLRVEGYSGYFTILADRHELARGVELGTIVDTALVVMGPQGHRGFVEDCGWSVEQWASHSARLLRGLFA